MNLATIPLTERSAEAFVSANHTGFTTKWDGWNIKVFIPNPSAEYVPRGSYDRDTEKWGYTYTYRPTHKGKWYVKVPA
jgi:hypothetical protein